MISIAAVCVYFVLDSVCVTLPNNLELDIKVFNRAQRRHWQAFTKMNKLLYENRCCYKRHTISA